MNKFLSVLLLFLLLACSASVTHNNASIHFNQTEHDFGTLPLKKETSFSFEFSNPGETALVIYNVTTSCGCTAAEWTKIPVKSGKTGYINVKYDAAFPGVFNKEITVHYNGTDSPVILQIKGEVQYPDEMTGNDEEK